jgi:diguanylate cyclase (GGDEF)-like protein
VASDSSVKRLLRIIEIQNLIVGAGMGLDRVMQVVVEHAPELTGGHGAVIEMLDEGGEEFVCRAAAGTVAAAVGYRLARKHSLSGLSVDQRVPLTSPDSLSDPRVDQEVCRRLGVASMVCVPLLHEDAPVGVLSVVSKSPHAFGDEAVETLTLLGRVIAASIHHASAYESARHDSLHDALTGLENRRAFDEAIATAVERHRRYGSPLSLAILDLDGFKYVNDQWGHAAGDGALRQVAEVIRREKRAGDSCYRIGGDEFALLIADTPLDGARLAAERVCTAVRRAAIAQGSVGISAGVVEIADRDEMPAEFIARADAELYRAKRLRATPRGTPAVQLPEDLL